MHTLFERKFLGGISIFSMTNKKVPKIVDKHIRCDEVQKYETKDWAENLIQHGEDELQNLRKLIHDEVKITLNNLGLIT